MLRVLLLYYEPAPAGQTTHVVSLARGLVQLGHHVAVVLPQELRGSATALQGSGVVVIPVRMTKILWPAASIRDVVRLIRTGRFDLVHIHSQEAGLLGRCVASAIGARPIVYTPQVIEIRRTAWQPVYARLEWLLSLVTDRIIAVNDGDRRRMEGWRIPSHKIVTIPNGVPIDCQPDVSLAESMRASLGIRRDQALVMQVGRLSPQKDPLAFVEGARRVVASRPGVHFALVGEGPLHGAVVSRIRELGLTGQVHLMGWQDSARDLMVGAQVVTLTSRWEGTPYALLEAMARSRTVVATAVNGCREVVEDGQNGFLVAAGDPDAWADRVVWLLDHPDNAAEMGRTGRRIVEARYSVDRMVHRTLDLYQRVLNGL